MMFKMRGKIMDRDYYSKIVNTDNSTLLEAVFSVLGNCSDDYFFLWDIENDRMLISTNAQLKFDLPGGSFSNVLKVLENVSDPEDFAFVKEEMLEIQHREKSTHNVEYRWIDRNGNRIWLSSRASVIYSDDEKVYLMGRISEISRKNKIDGVTGLYLSNSLKLSLSNYMLETDLHGYIIIFGIDSFKNINEKYGTEIGDAILKNTAECITNAFKNENVNFRCFRMNGDEIAVLVDRSEMTDSVDPATESYRSVRKFIDNSPITVEQHIYYSVSAGIIYFDNSNLMDELLIEKAEYALHHAKTLGRNSSCVFDSKVFRDYLHSLDVREALCRDVDNNFHGFEMYYQPIANIKEHKVLGAEALIRWTSDQYGFMIPAEFVPILEDSGLIIPLGRWIINTSIKQCREWMQYIPDFRMNINLSFVQLKKSAVLQDIKRAMKKYQMSWKNVMFEVTESGELEKGNSIQILKNFKNENLNLAIDDFGTGYSNLRYVKEMTFDLVKIDQSFIRDIRENKYDYIVVKQFTELAHMLNLKVCYEGVETKDDFDFVLQLDPDYIQGYYFAKPLPAAEFEEKFIDRTSYNNKSKFFENEMEDGKSDNRDSGNGVRII
jgi:diguanylate cyclase (GGDEF)-like protein